MFVPERVKVPLPTFSKEPEAVSLITPEKVVELSLAPTESTSPEPICTEPLPLNAPRVSLSVISRVLLLPTVTLLSSSNALPPDTAKVPALRVVSPLKVLVPESVRVPLPSLTNAPLPLITPETLVLMLLLLVRVLLPSSISPAPLIAPTVSSACN